MPFLMHNNLVIIIQTFVELKDSRKTSIQNWYNNRFIYFIVIDLCIKTFSTELFLKLDRK